MTVRLAVLLEDFLRAQPLGVLFSNDTGFVLSRSPDTVRGPDVALVTKERFEAVGDVPTHFPGPPDLAIEVLSPDNRAGDVRAKIADYFAAGTRLVWVVDPASAEVTVYRTLLSPRVLKAEDFLDAADLLPGFSARVAEFFEI